MCGGGRESGGVEDSAYREEWGIVGHVKRTWTKVESELIVNLMWVRVVHIHRGTESVLNKVIRLLCIINDKPAVECA